MRKNKNYYYISYGLISCPLSLFLIITIIAILKNYYIKALHLCSVFTFALDGMVHKYILRVDYVVFKKNEAF